MKRWKKENNYYFLIKDEDGELFGYYLHTDINYNHTKHILIDEKSFHFNLVFNIIMNIIIKIFQMIFVEKQYHYMVYIILYQ